MRSETVAGVKLDNNTEDETKRTAKLMTSKSCEIVNCGWSETQQQHSKHETKRTVMYMTSKPSKLSLFSHKKKTTGTQQGER
jgi:hypothetical protein